jgi:GTP-binding protein Era
VEIERWSEGPEKREIHGAIWVERPGQRAIILGHQGSRIKEVGIEARREIEHRFGRPVRLELWVKVRSGWTDDLRALRQLGYDSEQS